MNYAQQAHTANYHPPGAQHGLTARGSVGQPAYSQHEPVSRQETWARTGQTAAPPGPSSSSCWRAIQLGYQLHSSLPEGERSRLKERGRKLASFRKLAVHEGIPASTLWRALAIYQLYRRFPELGCYRHLGVAHLSVILGIDESYQLYFMRMAEIERWSRRRLDREVKGWQAYVTSLAARPAVGQS